MKGLAHEGSAAAVGGVRESSRSAGPPEAERWRLVRRVRAELVLEGLLVVLAGILFGYMLSEALRVHPDVGRLPKIASGFGFAVLLVYLVRRLLSWGRSETAAQIMDTGFDEEGIERRDVILRTLRVTLTLLALFAGIRLFGFHVALPLYIFGYLLIWGRVRWYWAVLAAGGFELYIVLAYDVAVRSFWPDPLVPGFPG